MLQIRRRLDLGKETFGAEYSGEIGFEDLQCDTAVVADVVRQEDRCHAARTDLTHDAVAVGERFYEVLLRAQHVGLNMAPRASRRESCTPACSHFRNGARMS